VLVGGAALQCSIKEIKWRAASMKEWRGVVHGLCGRAWWRVVAADGGGVKWGVAEEAQLLETEAVKEELWSAEVEGCLGKT
jgi:hypothetical protein